MSILVRLRRFIIPAGIALVLLVAILSYNFSILPRQRTYLDDRNIRVLKTLSDRIRVSINSFDKMMDNAAEGGIKSGTLEKYLANLAPQLEIVGKEESRAVVGNDYGDPPKMAIAVDEGTHFLYLSFKGRSSPDYVIRSDLDRMIDKLSPPANRCPFDAIVLAQADGTVVYQSSQSGIAMARILAFENASDDAARGKADKLITLDVLSETSRLERVRLAGAIYRLYSQPLQPPFEQANPPRRGVDKSKPDDADKGKHDGAGESASKPWVLCGLVRDDRFRAESQAISDTAVLCVFAVILLAIAAIPFLKLYVSSRAERIRRSDVAAVAVSCCLGAAIATFVLMDLGYWHMQRDQSIKRQMTKLAKSIDENFGNESDQAFAQLQTFNTDAKSSARLERALQEPKEVVKSKRPTLANGGTKCNPTTACLTNLRSLDRGSPGLLDAYPYLQFVTWSDSHAQQRVKWTTRRSVTPFLNLDDKSSPYYAEVKKAFQSVGDRNQVSTQGIGSQYSPNTGENVTVFWKLFDRDPKAGSKSPDQSAPDNWFCASLVTKPISVVDPILPGGFQFAILKLDGTVVFHSDQTRNLRENFFVETDQNQELRSRVAMRTEGSLTAKYMGRSAEMYVHPMTKNSYEQWTVVVFHDVRSFELANREVLSVATILFLYYGVLIASVLALMQWGLRAKVERSWFWPDSRKKSTYRVLAAFNAFVCIVLLDLSQGSSLLIVLIFGSLLPVGAFALNLAILRGDWGSKGPSNNDKEGSNRWQHAYVAACATLVAAVAVVPCLPFFKVACDFEQKLLIESGQLKLAADIDGRASRVRLRYQGANLEDDAAKLLAPPGVESIPKYSYHEELDTKIESTGDIDQSTLSSAGAADHGRPWLESLLSWCSPLYDRLSADSRFLAASESSDMWTWASASPIGAGKIVFLEKEPGKKLLKITSPWQPFVVPWWNGRWWAGTAALMAVLFALVWSTLKRVFLFDLVTPTPEKDFPVNPDATKYESLFTACSQNQKLALVQLAQEGIVNPKDRDILCELIKTGLVRRTNGIFKVAEEGFENYTKDAVNFDTTRDWETKGVAFRFLSLRTSLIAGLGLAIILMYSQSDVLNTWATFVGGLAALVPAYLRLLDNLRGNKSEG